MQDEAEHGITLSQHSDFQADLGKARSSSDKRAAMKKAAKTFTTSKRFITSPRQLPMDEGLDALARALDASGRAGTVSPETFRKEVEKHLGFTAEEAAAKKLFEEPLAQLRDSILAIKLLPEEHHRPLAELARRLRDIEAVLEAARDASFPADGTSLNRFRRRALVVPDDQALASALSTRKQREALEKQQREAAEQARQQAESKLQLYRRIDAAIKELTELGPDALYNTPQQPSVGHLLPSELLPDILFQNAMKQTLALGQAVTTHKQNLLKMPIGDFVKLQAADQTATTTASDLVRTNQLLRTTELLKAGKVLRVNEPVKTKDGEASKPTEPATLPDLALTSAVVAQPESAEPLQALLLSRQLQPTGKDAFTPVKVSELSFRLADASANALSAATRALLKERRLEPGSTSLDHIVDTLDAELKALAQELEALIPEPVEISFKRVNHTLVSIKTPRVIDAIATLPTLPDFVFLPPVFLPDMRVPSTHGSVAPAGVADLLVVRQQLVGYEGADVAHIENVLRGEKKEREHTRREMAEELLFQEIESTAEEERELASTDRFEMSRETSEVIKEEASVKAGLSLTGKYGPVVEFSVSAEAGLSASRESAVQSAASFSKEVTARSATRISERVLKRTSLKLVNEITERNLHGIDNTAGGAHISGVYQWVNKVYQAQMFNYGLRTLYDFMVPEPGAWLARAMQEAHAGLVEIEKPAPFTLRPDQISEHNYFHWVQLYGATDVVPPPERYITKAVDYSAGGADSKTSYNHSGVIQVDEGYKAMQGSIARAINIWDDKYTIDVVLGRRFHRFDKNKGAVWTVSLSEETGALPFAINTFRCSDVAMAIEVKCQRTERAMTRWRLDTHAKLTNAYRARLADYEEKLRALETQAGVAIRGKNAELNLQLMKDELKKNCVSILTDQHFDLFGAVSADSDGLPRINLHENEAEGPYVRFFEQAFEWEHMTWVTYPYFWGRKSQWRSRIAYEDDDPMFNDFLKAGYCRVVVPARPGFEGAIDHFTTYGEVWNGGPLPAVTSSHYLPIAAELAERMSRPGEELPEGEPWLVRVPTTLVKLRADDRLPSWQLNDAGRWVEA